LVEREDPIMVEPLTSRISRLVVLPLVVAGALAVAGPAAATDYCVAPNDSCAGANNLTDFQVALDKAAAASSADRIFLGAATYTAKNVTGSGFVYNPPGDWPVEVVGVGQSGLSATVVTGELGNVGVLSVFGGPDSSVHDLSIVLPPLTESHGHGLWTNGTARRVTVTEDKTQTDIRVGVKLSAGAVLEDHSVVDLAHSPETTGVLLDDGGQIVRDSTIGAYTGIRSGAGGTIERTRVSAEMAGVVVDGGTTNVSSSRIATSSDGSVGIEANIGLDTTVDLDGVTVVGPGAGVGSGTGVNAYNVYFPTKSVDLHLKNSIIRGYPVSLYAGGLAPGHARVEASYSDYDPSGNFTTGTTATIAETNVSNIGNVGFGDGYALAADSPLIDAGDPATAQGLDIDSNPLVADGTGDGVARRDIGAYEFPALLPPADTPAPAGDAAPASGGTPAVPARDATAPVLSGLRVSHRAFAVGRARTAVSARQVRSTRFTYSLSETAKVVVTIRRVVTRRTAGRLIRSARSGSNVLRFSGRIGSKALKPGRYRAVLTATDAAGNRSAPKSVSFRVLRNR
jgi:hypothetical protein